MFLGRSWFRVYGLGVGFRIVGFKMEVIGLVGRSWYLRVRSGLMAGRKVFYRRMERVEYLLNGGSCVDCVGEVREGGRMENIRGDCEC